MRTYIGCVHNADASKGFDCYRVLGRYGTTIETGCGKYALVFKNGDSDRECLKRLEKLVANVK
jgi:hypothetical protein